MENLALTGRVLRRWWWLILLFALVAGGTTAAVSLELPKTYSAKTVALVNPKQPLPPNSVTGVDTALPTIDQLVLTYSQLLNTEPVRQKLVADGIPRSTAELAKEVTTKREPNTTLIDINVNDRDPAVAQLIASDVITAFNKSLDELQAKAGADTTSRLDALVAAEVPHSVPTIPSSPNIPLNTGVALLFGLVLGVGLAFLLERLDNTIKSDVDVRTRLGLTLLGAVQMRGDQYHNEGSADAVELLTATRPNHPMAESYRAVRTNVLFSRIDEGLGAILVTSTIPSEGKTSAACNLAVTLAHAGHSVILIDADFRRPSLKGIFGLSSNRGLSDVLLDPALTEKLISATEVPGLRVLTSGDTPPNPSELLGSNAMDRLLNQLRDEGYVIILDTPPIGAVTDATVLSALVDGVIMVVERGRTLIPQITKATGVLEAVGANILGVILNKAKNADASAYYFYYYSKPVDDDETGGNKTKSKSKRRGAEGGRRRVPEVVPPPP